ncbi:MAG: helix-turn-helix domain-containing protein [Aeromonadaceae bacterium]
MTKEQILQARRELVLSQAAFAELMLVSARAVKYWESGERKPSKLAVQRMKDLTGELWGD